MISAMYENGGNTTHRLLDGHPELFVYPFESQVGTALVSDHMSSLFPLKYRWPCFDLAGTAASDYEAIIDEECKVRIKTPSSSKFRETPIQLSDTARKDAFMEHMVRGPRTRGRIVESFFRATFEAWKDRQASGLERTYVGYSPIIVVDADKILADLPGGHVLHVVRNPWSAYADTKKRAVPRSIEHYMLGWTTCQYFALLHRERAPDRVHVLRYEDIVLDPGETLGRFCRELSLRPSPTLSKPTWNGRPLETVHPWGTIRTPSPEANVATALELSDAERDEVARRARPYLDLLGYGDFFDRLAGAAGRNRPKKKLGRGARAR
jgi:hypothetical protein